MRVLRWIRDGWVILGLTLALVLVADRILDALLEEQPGWSPVSPGVSAPDRQRSPVYAGHPWADRYWAEHDDAKSLVWSPYVYWQRQPFAGETIAVDADGVRRTWTPSGAGGPVVWVFGGSSVWGTGVADDYTVPSQLARLLAEAGAGARVVNFGESGFVSTQSLIRLQLELGHRPVPDMVVFLGGANDVFSALQARRPGWPQNEWRRRVEFRSSQGMDEYLALFPALLSGIAKLTGGEPSLSPDLADAVVDRLLHNVRQADALARELGFRLIWFWQPTVFSRATPSEYEARVIASSLAPHRALQLAADRLVAQRQLLFLADRNLRDDPQPLFLDFVHLGPAGNRKIAETILAAIQACPERPGLCRP